jgi:hypothetical protein
MVLHFWLIPALVILVAATALLYLAVRLTGGSGVRTEGRTVVDKPVDDENRSS